MGFFRHLKILLLSVCFLLVLVAASCSAAVETPTSGPVKGDVQLEDCQLAASGISRRIPAQCGRVQVYENRQAQSGRQIDLHIAIIEATSRTPAPDPLFILTGGPGQAASETYVSLAGAFNEVHRERDIVLLDQRGTGQSNPLRCDFPEELETDPDASLGPYLKTCLETLSGDPTQYTTTLSAQDLDDVRQALGYQQVNLYGVSYGTRLALVYLRLFPDQVRSVVLDGLAPPQIALGYDMAADAQHAWDLIAARCESQLACEQAFPDLNQNFEDLMAHLEVKPVHLSMSHPVSGEHMEIDFNAEMAASVIRFHSYAPETVALLPLLIHTAQVGGNYEPLAAQFFINTGQLESSIANAMSYSVVCTEDVPFYEDESPASGAYLGSLLVEGFREICDIWPSGDLPADFHEPVRSDVAVLLLSGEYDPVTPPAYADLAAETLPNSRQLVAPGMGHNVVGRGCLPDLVAEFYASADASGLDSSCISQIEPFPFFVNFSGPMP